MAVVRLRGHVCFTSTSYFQTMFTVKTDVIPNADEKNCKVGNLATLKIQVFQMPHMKPPSDQEYLYEVQGQTNWSCHGKSTGMAFLYSSYKHFYVTLLS